MIRMTIALASDPQWWWTAVFLPAAGGIGWLANFWVTNRQAVRGGDLAERTEERAIRDEEWIVRSVKTEASGGRAVTVRGVSELVRDREAIFLDRLDPIRVLEPEKTELVPDTSPRYTKTRLYLESPAFRSRCAAQ